MYNKVIIIGNLTKDIELKFLPSGSSIANCSIATSHKYKMQNGEQKEEVCFLDFSIFGKGGEIFKKYVGKGSKVMLEGRLVFQQWKAKDGTNRSRHALNVSDFKFLDSKGSTSSQGGYEKPPMMDEGGSPASNNTYSDYNNNSNTKQQESYNGGNTNQASQQQKAYEEKLPEIDIDNDEIPF